MTDKKTALRKGGFNVCELHIGVPGCGKSTRATARALDLSHNPGCYVLAHDPAHRIPEKDHTGKRFDVRWHDSTEQARSALGSRPVGIHAVACANPDDVILLAIEASRASLAKSRDGMEGIPVLVYIDEGVTMGGATPYRLSPAMRELLATRRHLHVGLIITMQSPQFMHYSMISMATKVTCGRLNDQRGIKRLIEGGIPPEKANKIPNLSKFGFIEHDFE